MIRPSKDAYYLNIAKAVSERSTCIRRQYGCVIVKDDRIIATGYNGAARGKPNCCDSDVCWREENNIPHGERYEECVAVHAENNALHSAGRESVGATLYLWGGEYGEVIDSMPCKLCNNDIINAQIARVVTSEKK